MSFNAAQFISSRLLVYYRNRTQEQNRLLMHIRKLFPSPLAEHIQYCVTDAKKLLLYTDKAAWASLLRFNYSEILTAVNTASDKKFDSVQIRIMKPIADLNAVNQVEATVPSSETIIQILKQSEKMPAAELKQSLKKLGETLALKRNQ